jgi:TetR/AcrR family transcriptional regulator, cholesterol catabolism regulator
MKKDKNKPIINAAIELFSHTHDFRRVSLEAIAKEAHISPTTIYNNFGTRENLINEVIKTLILDNLNRTRDLINSCLPFPQKLMGIINGKLNMNREVSSEIINKLVSQDKTIALFVEQMYQKEIKPLWKQIVIEGKNEGYIDPELDNEALLIYLDVLQAGFKSRPELLEGIKINSRLIEQLAHLMYYGFLIKEIVLFEKQEDNAR